MFRSVEQMTLDMRNQEIDRLRKKLRRARQLLEGYPAFNCEIGNDCYDDCLRTWHDARTEFLAETAPDEQAKEADHE
jgi:hypothetical protein